MRKFLFLSIFIISSLGLTSCLDLFEDIQLHKDGSGEYRLVMTIGEQFKQQIAEALKEQEQLAQAKSNQEETKDQEDVSEDNEQDSYKESLEKITEKLKTVQGISNVQMVYNDKDFEFGYTFHFQDVAVLNKALEVAAGEFQPKLPSAIQVSKKKTITPTATYIELNKGTLVRHQSAELSKLLEMKKPGANNAGMMGGLDVSYILQDLNYKTVFQFAQPIKSTNNEAAIVDDKNHTVTLSCKPFAYKPTELEQQKLQELSCSQSIVIELK